MVTKLSWIYLSICESQIWPLMWGLIYVCKDWVQMTIAQILEKAEANQQVVNWNELSSVKPISSLVSHIDQSEPSVQIEDVLFPIIRTTCPKLLSLSPNIISTPHKCSGPLLYHRGCLQSERQNHGREARRTQPSWEEGSLLSFPNELHVFPLSCSLSVNS